MDNIPDIDNLLNRLECSKCGDLPANITVKHIKGDASLRAWLETVISQAKKVYKYPIKLSFTTNDGETISFKATKTTTKKK